MGEWKEVRGIKSIRVYDRLIPSMLIFISASFHFLGFCYLFVCADLCFLFVDAIGIFKEFIMRVHEREGSPREEMR